MKKIYFLVLFALVLSFSGCNKDDEPLAEAAKMKLFENLQKLGIPEAMKNSSNSNAQEAASYFDQVTGVADYYDFLDYPDDAKRDGNNYYWSYGGFSLWEEYSESSASYNWDVYIKTTETAKLHYFHSEESKDGKTGKLQMYSLETSNQVIYIYDWTFDATGNLTMTEKFADGSWECQLKSNIDLSGSAKYYTNGKLLYSFIWNSDGSGSYEWYDDNGTIVFSDKWTKADL